MVKDIEVLGLMKQELVGWFFEIVMIILNVLY